MMEVEEDVSQNDSQKKICYMHLIIFEKGAATKFYERCHVRVKRHRIFVTPYEEDAYPIQRTMDDNFIRFKNVICFFSSNTGFALVFDHKRHCRQVHDVLEDKKVNSGNTPISISTFEKRFVVPMINELRDYDKLDFEFKVIILKLLKSLEDEQKQRLAPLIIGTKIDQRFIDCILKGVEFASKEPSPSKRRRSTSRDPEAHNEKISNRKSKFSLSNPARVSFQLPKEGDYGDEECSPSSSKKPRLSTNSIQSPINLDPITLPFEVIDYTQSGISKTHLFIFTSKDKTSCFEFYWEISGKRFKCVRQKCRKPGVEVRKDADGNDQVYFFKPQCPCPPLPFDRERYKNDILVFQPNYKITQELNLANALKPKLYVYTSEDKKKAYKFDYDVKNDRYVCMKCRNKHFLVRAITCKNEDGGEHVAIQDREHKCDPIDC